MAKTISQQRQIAPLSLTRSEKVQQRFSQQRAEQQAFYSSPVETQKRDVNSKIAFEQQRLIELEEERQDKTKFTDNTDARQQINDRYQTLSESVNSRIRALNDIKRELSKGTGTFEPQFIEGYVESYERASGQSRQRSLAQSDRRRDINEQNKQVQLQNQMQQEQLASAKIVDTLTVENLNTGSKKYFAVSDAGKTFEIQKPAKQPKIVDVLKVEDLNTGSNKKYFTLDDAGKTVEIPEPVEWLKQVEIQKADFQKQLEDTLSPKRAELSTKPLEHGFVEGVVYPEYFDFYEPFKQKMETRYWDEFKYGANTSPPPIGYDGGKYDSASLSKILPNAMKFIAKYTPFKDKLILVPSNILTVPTGFGNFPIPISLSKIKSSSTYSITPSYVISTPEKLYMFGRKEVTRQPRRETLQDMPHVQFVKPKEQQGIKVIISGGVLVEDIKTGIGEKFDEGIEYWTEKDIKAKGIIEKLEPEYQQRYQVAFERQWFEPIVRGEIDFESAKAKFSESQVAKDLGLKYAQEVNYMRSGADKSFWTQLKYTFADTSIIIAGLSMGKGLTELAIPTSTKELVSKGIVLGGAVVAFKYVPLVAPALETAFVMKGTADFLNPMKLPEERFTGFVMAGVSGALLTARAVKWARTPTIKTRAIGVKPRLKKIDKVAKTHPVPSKAGKDFGYDKTTYKDIYGRTTHVQRFKFSKLDEQLIAGRRTIVSTQGRELIRWKPIYQGNPYVDKLGKIEAVKVLTQRTTLSLSEINKLLRYTPPKAIVFETKGMTMILEGDYTKTPQYITEGTRIATPEIRIVNRALGIKTRGGFAVKESFSAQGSAIKQIGDYTIFKSDITSVKSFLTKEGIEFSKLTQAGKTTKTFRQITAVKTEKLWEFGDKASAELLKEQSIVNQLIPKLRRTFESGGDVLAFSKKQPTIYHYEEPIQVRDSLGLKKQPQMKSIESWTIADSNKFVESLEKVYGKFSPVKTPIVVSPTTTSGSTSSVSASIKQIMKGGDIQSASAYAGKGTYEVTPTTSASINQIMKGGTKLRFVTAPTLPVLEAKLSTLPKLASTTDSILKSTTLLGLASVNSLSLKQQTKLANKLDEIQKLDFKFDFDLKQNPKLKQRLDTSPSLRTITQPPPIPPRPPRFPDPPPTSTPMRTLPPIIANNNALLRKILKMKKKSKRKDAFSFAPSFTEKALGIKPVKIDVNMAEKLLKKQFTGFELLPVVRLK